MGTVAVRPRREAESRTAAPARSHSLLLLGNAHASGVGRTDVLEEARAALRRAGARVETRLTESVDELAAVWAEDGPDRVVLLGGDGTLHAVANLAGPPRELALLPAGRANNVAGSLGIPGDLEAAARLAVEGRARPLDGIEAVGAARRYVAVEGVSVGFLARARTRYRAENSADLRAGLRAGLAELRSFAPLPVSIASDGAAETITVDQLFVANMARYAFGLRVAPEADPGDGLLDLVAIRAPSRLALVAMLARLRNGSHLGRPGVRTWRARRVLVGTGGRSPVVCDSENLGSGPVALSVKPAALKVVAP